MATRIFNANSGTATLPWPYGQILTPGSGVIVSDSQATVITNLGGLENLARSGLQLSDAPSGSSITPVAILPAVAGGNTGATAPGFTGTAPTRAVATALVTGTGMTASGQVMTSTDNKTATLNQYAGCWLITATHAPTLIVSHPAASAAPLVLTVLGAATTDAGAYQILAAPTPAGTVASHTHAQT